MYGKEIILPSLYTRRTNMEFLEESLLKLMSNILKLVHQEQAQI